MTPYEAITIVGNIIMYEYSASKTDKGDAIKLCLEALQRHEARGYTTLFAMMKPLPSETLPTEEL